MMCLTLHSGHIIKTVPFSYELRLIIFEMRVPHPFMSHVNDIPRRGAPTKPKFPRVPAGLVPVVSAGSCGTALSKLPELSEGVGALHTSGLVRGRDFVRGVL